MLKRSANLKSAYLNLNTPNKYISFSFSNLNFNFFFFLIYSVFFIHCYILLFHRQELLSPFYNFFHCNNLFYVKEQKFPLMKSCLVIYILCIIEKNFLPSKAFQTEFKIVYLFPNFHLSFTNDCHLQYIYSSVHNCWITYRLCKYMDSAISSEKIQDPNMFTK